MYREKHQKIKALFSVMLVISMFWANTVWALPQGGTVVGGSSAISQPNSTTMQINQTTDKSIINWQGYSIGANEKVQYIQPSSGSISLNRVVGQDPSLIYGQLSANGQVWVINPNGLLIGNGAQINVGSFLGSTLNVNDNDFMNGNYKFQAVSGQLSAISNSGNITSAQGGYVVLISPSITNEGTITTNLGKTYLASADEVTLNFAGNDLIGFTIDKAAAADALGIKNTGSLTANGGQIILSAKAASDLLKTVINNTGIIQAQTIENKSGKIYLLGGLENNAINVGGTLDASAPNGGDGGFIETSAASVKVTDDAIITTYAPYGKTGTWLIDPTDYNIAASGGDMTGAALSTNLGTTNVTILSSSGAAAGSGDINVNDAVSWNTNTLTLTAAHDININAVMTASGTSALTMNTATANGADSAVAGGTVKVGFNTDGTFKGRVDFGARSGTGFLTINGNGYTVINSLGAEGSFTGIDLQGMRGNLALNYALGSNIDASATSTWNSNAGFAPVGDYITSFTGAFDGLRHTITGLTINRPSTDFIGLFGYTNGATIRNVGLLGGSVTGNGYVGGLVGVNNGGTITDSYSTGAVSGSYSVGGLVGRNYGTITDSYSTGAVSGSYSVGGLVGENYGDITNSYSTGSVTGSDDVGGLVGDNYGTISNSYSTGTVIADSSYWGVGGLVGYNYYGTITDSYSTGAVSGTGYDVGGLVGYNEGGTITNSYSTGSVTARGDDVEYVGGLVGYNYYGTITNSYSTSAVTAGNDNGSSSYAYYVGGLVGENDGTISNSYSTGSVTARGADVEYVGGLVGENYGTIDNSYSESAVTAGNADGSSSRVYYVGGLAGENDGTISNSYSTGSVTARGADVEYVGGLVGENYGTIDNSYSESAVTAGNDNGSSSYAYYVGGLVGSNDYGAITNSYSTGSVTAMGNDVSDVGGLAGSNSGTISNSYWDTTTSGQATSADGTGLTTAEMKQLATFSGWSIASTGGSSATWRIYEGYTYPLLRSFLTPLTVTADNVTKTYDGTAWNGELQNVNYSGADTSKIFNLNTPYGAGSGKNVGSYTPQLYSNQQGYDISYVDGELTITPAASVASTSAQTTVSPVLDIYGIMNTENITDIKNFNDTIVLTGASAPGLFTAKDANYEIEQTVFGYQPPKEDSLSIEDEDKKIERQK